MNSSEIRPGLDPRGVETDPLQGENGPTVRQRRTHCGAETDPRRVGMAPTGEDTRGDAREKLERTIAKSSNRTPREKEHRGSGYFLLCHVDVGISHLAHN